MVLPTQNSIPFFCKLDNLLEKTAIMPGYLLPPKKRQACFFFVESGLFTRRFSYVNRGKTKACWKIEAEGS